jgi:hypothetical protein
MAAYGWLRTYAQRMGADMQGMGMNGGREPFTPPRVGIV